MVSGFGSVQPLDCVTAVIRSCIVVPNKVLVECKSDRFTALVPLPAGEGTSLPPELHHPVLGEGHLPPPAGGRGSAGVHHPARRGDVRVEKQRTSVVRTCF